MISGHQPSGRGGTPIVHATGRTSRSLICSRTGTTLCRSLPPHPHKSAHRPANCRQHQENSRRNARPGQHDPRPNLWRIPKSLKPRRLGSRRNNLFEIRMQHLCHLRIRPRHAMQTVPRHQAANRQNCPQASHQRQPNHYPYPCPHPCIHPRQRATTLIQRQRNHRSADRPQPAQRRHQLHPCRQQAQPRSNPRYQRRTPDRRLPLHLLRLWRSSGPRTITLRRSALLLLIVLQINLRRTAMRTERRHPITGRKLGSATVTILMHIL
jgi:hypothetical protein